MVSGVGVGSDGDPAHATARATASTTHIRSNIEIRQNRSTRPTRRDEMHSTYNPRTMKLSPVRAALYGGLAAGALDLLDAFVFFWFYSGAPPAGILQSIAAGWLGRNPARAGGMPTAMLGLLSHCMIATIFASAYVWASGYVDALRRQWVVCGLLYGVAAYFVMTWVVVPVSNAGGGISLTLALPARPVLINGLLIHALGVGLPIAYFAARRRVAP